MTDYLNSDTNIHIYMSHLIIQAHVSDKVPTSGNTENSWSVFSRLFTGDMFCTVNRHLTGSVSHSVSYVTTFVSV